MHTKYRGARLISAISLLVFLSLATPAIAGPGTAGWYWPTGSESFSMSGWWDFRGYCWHLAQDMGAAAGRPVYAVGAGTVLESKFVSGYGPGGGQGGAVVILHKTATGAEFKALYGHLYDLRYTKGASVPAGAVVGRVNNSSPNHLHFGIHPGRAYPPDNNPFRGHTYTSSTTYGWVNPVTYLKTHPRVLSFAPPAVPQVASIATTVAAQSAGARDGVAYWQYTNGDGALERWSYAIASRQLQSTDATPPAFDATRYVVTNASSPTRLIVKDRRPVLTLRTADATPGWRRSTRLYGTLKNAAAQPFVGATVIIERRSGASWIRVSQVLTGRDGAYALTFTPSAATTLRARFASPSLFANGLSSAVTVKPHVSLTAPTLSRTAPLLTQSFSATSMLVPEHATSAVVYFQYDYYGPAGWGIAATRRAGLTDAGSATQARAPYACARRGAWRVRSVMAEDAGHALTYSAPSYFTVR